MTFKTLKHKTLEDTFGVMVDVREEEGDYIFELYHSPKPELYPPTAEKEEMKKYWEKVGWATIVKQLDDYDLVEVELTIK